MLWKLSLKILTPYCQTCKKEDLLWETLTIHSQPYLADELLLFWSVFQEFFAQSLLVLRAQFAWLYKKFCILFTDIERRI